MIVKGPREDVESYLDAIEQLRGNIKFFSNNKSFKSSDAVVNHANNLLVKAVSKLEEEFKQLLSVYRYVIILLLCKAKLFQLPCLTEFLLLLIEQVQILYEP